MLKVSLHAGPLSGISQFNQLGRLDIGYETLAPKATYKAVLFARGEGALPLVRLEGYPRWSGSIWDLVARAIALSLTKREELLPMAEPAERPAYAEAMCAVIDHVPRGVERYRARLGTVILLKAGRKGCYRASLQEDCFEDRPEVFFMHRPKRLVHWDLLARAVNWSLANQEHLPERPQAGLEMGGIPLVTMLSQVTGLPAAFIRKEAKEYGTCRYAEGAPLAGKRFTLVEDVVSSGGAIVDALQKLRADGLNPDAAVCVIDRETGGSEALAEMSLQLRALYTFSEIDSAAA
jgi:orotate phosphoribosyltransferase